jgi:alanine dehydrogenase
MIESGAGESSSYSDKEYSDAGAEVTKDTAKVFGCPMILKVGPPTLAENCDEQPDNPDLIDPIKTMQKVFEALSKKR